MNLVWKLLRRHISPGQLGGFALANLAGMLTVLLGWQFYNDVLPVLTGGDSFMSGDYIIMSKRITTGNTLSGTANTFTRAEMAEIGGQQFVKALGQFTATEYKVDARMGVNGMNVLSSELFFESVPDHFVDVPLNSWKWQEGDNTVPIILPRSYLTMYNFGFAQSHSLPKISDGLVGMIDFTLFVQGNGHRDTYKGRVIGFSNRLNSILVPQTFMDWSNAYYAPDKESLPSRVIIEVANRADERIVKYVDSRNYDVADDRMAAEKTTYFLRLIVTLVMGIGIVISALSFYILMLSIYLLVQKNSEKLENLLLIGYTPARVARPYQLLTIALNLAVLIAAWAILAIVRSYYTGMAELLFPDIDEGTMAPAILLGLALFAIISIINIAVIRRKVMRIWKRKD